MCDIAPDYFLPGCDIAIVDHVVRTDKGREWDGPGLIRYECWDMTKEEAVALAKTMQPKSKDAVVVRAYDRVRNVWLDTMEPAWNAKVHKNG